MSDCCNPSGYRDFFSERQAERSLRRYDKRGLDGMARSMVDFLMSRGVEGHSVLEAGGGIGAIQVELLKAGAASAVNVELSGEYERVAAELLAREGLHGRADRRIGDFTDLASALETDDVVMNRVICCYPFLDRLMGSALSSSRRFLAATFPRDRMGAKLALSLGNAYCTVRGIEFRSFLHSPEDIMGLAASAGFEPVFHDHDLFWRAVVWERAQTPRE